MKPNKSTRPADGRRNFVARESPLGDVHDAGLFDSRQHERVGLDFESRIAAYRAGHMIETFPLQGLQKDSCLRMIVRRFISHARTLARRLPSDTFSLAVCAVTWTLGTIVGGVLAVVLL